MVKVLVNASPLIFLAKAGLLDILRKLFDEVATVRSVIDEIEKPLLEGMPAPEASTILQAQWITVLELTTGEKKLAERWAHELGIDRGEAEAATLYKRGAFDAMIVADEVAERKLRQRGVNTRDITEIGTLAVYRKHYDLRKFAEALFNAGYRTRRVRALLT